MFYLLKSVNKLIDIILTSPIVYAILPKDPKVWKKFQALGFFYGY